MKVLFNFFNRDKIKWYADIASLNKFIPQKKFNLNNVICALDTLQSPDDEICIHIPTKFKHKIQLSIWGKDSNSCLIERVVPEKQESYWKPSSKTEAKNLLSNLQEVVENPEEFGFTIEDWK